MNNNVQIEFIRSGLHTIIVDGGRPGWQDKGIPIGGAMDRKAFHLANALVGNDIDAPALECVFSGPKFKIKGKGWLAYTGGQNSVTKNGVSISSYRSIPVNSGDEIAFGIISQGVRTYIAISGRMITPKWLESSTATSFSSPRIKLNSVIQRGRHLQFISGSTPEIRAFKEHKTENQMSIKTLFALPGPENSIYSEEETKAFWNNTYKVLTDSSRMGLRLNARKKILTRTGKKMISSGIIPGTVQLLPSGNPVLLLADAQTTGGYPRIATVIYADLDKAGQLKPGDQLRFHMVDLKQAQKLLVEYKEYIKTISL